MSRRYHLLIDAVDCKSPFLANRDKLKEVTIQVAHLCGARIIHGPVIIEGRPTNPGLTVFAIIDFSHISLHTFSEQDELYIDIFSCEPIDFDSITNYLEKVFDLAEDQIRILRLGTS